MDIENKNGYTLRNLGKINFLIGKNGCGKSTILREVEKVLNEETGMGRVKYITPERGGRLLYNPSIEQNIVSDLNWLPSVLRKNQYDQFKASSIVQYRKLELLTLREIEQEKEIRENLEITFQTTINKVNALLDNIEIKREGVSFSIYQKGSDKKIEPDQISSGESELISLGIECLVFEKDCAKGKENILFLDEPDVHLHPDLQARLSLFLQDLLRTNKFRIVIASHSTALLGALGEYPDVSIEFISNGQKEIRFKKISDVYRKILPVFGAHPLSNIFNEAPIFLVEGEDDERVWQQAVRTAQGKIKIYPCSVDTISKLNEYEEEVIKIINSVYDRAKAYSLRDKDDIAVEEIQDKPPVIRFRLSCRAAENLLLSDDVLKLLVIEWDDLKERISRWIDSNPDHSHFSVMKSFSDKGFPRKSFNIKKIRNDLMGIIGSDKPWEVAVGQVIGKKDFLDSDNSIKNYLGDKIINTLFS